MKEYWINVYDAYGYVNGFTVYADRSETGEMIIADSKYVYTTFFVNDIRIVQLVSDNIRKFVIDEVVNV